MLARDLLQKHFDIFLESFKRGQDEGIDLRCSRDREGSLIVQCKHYAESGYCSLFSALKREKVKVDRLSPNRYCIATSVPLSPQRKRAIRELFHPYCRQTEDIFGQKDLNNLLELYPRVQRQHFKLWLTSSTVLERIVHSDIYNETLVRLKNMQAKAKVYVSNKSFADAISLLQELHYCIISGIPGIGKTILAEMLILDHVRRGFEPIVVRSNIKEAFALLKADVPQVIYYDDFLGQTGWEDKLEKNEEKSILEFIRHVKRSRRTKFVLTTREYILQQARSVYEKLHASEFDDAKCIIELGTYTRRNRARILYNHVYFSDLPLAYRRALASRSALLRVVDHENYSPRIVEWMCSLNHVENCAPSEYAALFTDMLDDPKRLWRHAFQNHLSPPARSLLVVLSSFQSVVALDDLRDAFNAYRNEETVQYGVVRSANEFRGSLDELEGSFIRCERSGSAIVVGFHNPSVRDFLESHIDKNLDQALNLCHSIVFYDQFRGVFSSNVKHGGKESLGFGGEIPDDDLSDAVLRTLPRTAKRYGIQKRDDGSIRAYRFTQNSPDANAAHALRMAGRIPADQGTKIGRRVLNGEKVRIAEGRAALSDIPDIVTASADVSGIESLRNEVIQAAQAKYESAETYDDLDDVIALKEFKDAAPGVLGDSFLEAVGESLSKGGEAVFETEFSIAEDEYDLEEIESKVEDLEVAFGVSLDRVRARLEMRSEEIERECQDEDPPEDRLDAGSEEVAAASDDEILSMFASMFE